MSKLTQVQRDFLHHLHDTVILLGGGTKVANMIDRTEALSESDVEELRDINYRLITSTKDRLVGVHSTSVVTTDE